MKASQGILRLFSQQKQTRNIRQEALFLKKIPQKESVEVFFKNYSCRAVDGNSVGDWSKTACSSLGIGDGRMKNF